MQLFFRRRYCHHSFSDATTKWVRDRGLDHAVEREKNLKPLINIKNLIKSEPSKSLPITIIAQQKDSLKIPIRPIDFVRKYPSVFQEFLPGNIGIHPHIKLTPEVLNLDAEEQLVYQSETYKKVVADRLLKLLMISRISEIPLKIIEILKWDLGLPQDYAKTIVPEFPDCFRIVRKVNGCDFSSVDKLELVCWSNEFAVSVVEKKAVDREKIVFPMKFSTGFQMDKKMKKSLDDWQKLPYISPYEDSSHLLSKSDESDKWAVAILHEVLSLFGSKKAERDNVLCLGEYLGIRSRFKRVLLNYPGIFYVSTKIGTYTAVLRDGYKRGSLIGSDPLMNIRSQYIHLMNTVKEDRKVVAVQSGNKQQEKGTPVESKGDGEDVCAGGEEEKDVESLDVSDNEEEVVSDDDFEDDDDEEEEEDDMHRRGAHKNAAISRGRTDRNVELEKKGNSRNHERGNSRGIHENAKEEVPAKYPRRRERRDENNVHGNSGERWNSNRNRRESSDKISVRENAKEEVWAKYPRRERRDENNARGNSGERWNSNRNRRDSSEKVSVREIAKEEVPAKYPRRERRDENNVRGNSGERWNANRNRRESSDRISVHENAKEEVLTKYPRRERRDENNVCGNSGERWNSNRNRRDSSDKISVRENAKEDVPAKYRRRERRVENNVHGNSGERLNLNRNRRKSSDKKISV
ncbi:hypothetical protein LWI29_032502 [Acer saccharum]|uniref:PORR domain-containing protein n=1 Tax=Acer saccharum TaxID=4024 RepID=A0AA39RP62_ACESA|nr:hypothetical protein LWI29_032502 [Acer saccharum]